jgi:subtilase family serine protease
VEITSPVEQRDTSAYLAAAGVTQTGTVTNVPIDGGGTYGGFGSAYSVEAALDVQTISGLAPGVNIRVYNFPDLSAAHIEDGYNQTVSDDLVSVVSSSFGGCENDGPAFADATNSIAEQGAAKGITFVASSGDSGSDECSTSNSPPGVLAPAGDPYFTSVGAVNFTQNATGALTSITAGMDGKFLSGGGVSTHFPLPAFQTGIPNVISSGRNSPDISLPGVDVAIFIDTVLVGGDGTSWSTPEFAALVAEANERQNRRGLGWINPPMYAMFTSWGYTDFTDVTTGNNGFYASLTGYDQVTGIGAPNGYAFATGI